MNDETRSWIHPIWPTSPTNKITKLSNVGILKWKCRKWAESHVWCSLHQKCFHSIKQYSLGNCFPASDRRAKSQTACGISQTTFSGYSMCFFVLVVCCACHLFYTVSPQTCYHASTAPYTYRRERTFPVSGMFLAFIRIINHVRGNKYQHKLLVCALQRDATFVLWCILGISLD